MTPLKVRKLSGLVLLLAVLVPALAACGGAPAAPQVVRETVVVQQTSAPQVVKETVVVQETVVAPTAAAAEAWTTPHPIIGGENGQKVRQAIAYCTNRPELIKSVYPYLSEDEQKGLLMDTFLPQGHWALATEGITTYPFDAAKGVALLEEAGWKLAEGDTVRANDAGDPLILKFTTTNAQFRVTWSTVLAKQLLDNCGIQILTSYIPGAVWFGGNSGLARRDFELGAFAWVGQADPGGVSLYACNQIPTPANNWEGQNYMGWCNETASKAVVAANNTLNRDERIKNYAILQQEFTKDLASLPLFNRLEASAWSKALKNFKVDSTEYYTANAGEWEVDGGDTVVIGFTQEPASMYGLAESAAVQATAAQLISTLNTTQYSYDFQAVGQKELPTIESGKAKNNDVDVKEGDMVWTTAGEPAALADGVEFTNAAGEVVVYKAGSGPVKAKQLVVTYDFVEGIKWQDGTPRTKADYDLGYKQRCDPESGAVTFTICDATAKFEATDGGYTVTYQPGYQDPTYFLAPFGTFPAHQVIESEGPNKGKKLAEVPAKDWATLKEIAELPLSDGPYILTSWEKGQKMTFEANPNYYKGAPKVKNVIIQFIADTNQAVAQLLTGDIDIVGKETLGAGPEVETVLKAAQEGKINAETSASPTWEHIDFNLFVK